MPGETKRAVLGKDTLIPLGLVVAICGGVVWISTQLTNINYKLDLLEDSLEDQWTKRDMENWGLKLKMGNPELQIPNLED